MGGGLLLTFLLLAMSANRFVFDSEVVDDNSIIALRVVMRFELGPLEIKEGATKDADRAGRGLCSTPPGGTFILLGTAAELGPSPF